MEHAVEIIPALHQTPAIDAPPDLSRLQDYLTSGLRPSTIKMYQHSIKFYEQFSRDCGLNSLDPQTLNRWRDYLVNETRKSPNTINRMMAAVKRLVDQMADNEMIEITVAYKFKNVKKVKVKAIKERLKKNAKTRITPKQMRRICESPDTTTLKGLRDRALLFCLATSGIRCSEAADLTVENVQEIERDPSEEEEEEYKNNPQGLYEATHGCVVIVQGKTDIEPRIAPLSPEAYEYIQHWLRVRKEHNISSPWVFTAFSTRGALPKETCLKSGSVWYVVKVYARQNGLPNVTTHDFRRYVGTRLAKKSVKTAKDALGHASVQTTIDHYDLNELQLNVTKNIL